MKMTGMKKILAFSILSLILIGFIGFVEKQTWEKLYLGRQISIEGESGLYFVEQEEIEEMISAGFSDLNPGLALSEVPLNEIENRLLGHPFVREAEAFIGQKGMLQVKLKQYKPIARIARPGAADGYITSEGKIIPMSNSYTSRVLIVEGDFAEKLMNQGEIMTEMPELLELIYFITEDEFWSAQITEIIINSPSDIQLYQQVGQQVIELGDARDLEDKFEKIEVFYKEILPRKGWNAYHRVSVKFKNQIVCE